MSEATPTPNPSTNPVAPAPRTITVTPAAIEWVKRIRTKENKDGESLRLGVKAGGCSGYSYFMGFTTARRPNDLVLEYEGLTVLVDPRSLEILDGTVVDYERGLLGTGIQFKNPRVKKSCGCGDSFSL
ncbi:MAG TPA: iron-sulfur cluster assembly accessory protein [Candidatus Eisenbacteria bacterium]|jgi:iron-sulfur cluster assembly protein|nr:iron-sulfur cluster assembly accessory protein [Candidatus Eisenbacteria bacterium]